MLSKSALSIFLFTVSLFALFSCDQQKTVEQNEKMYFDVQGFVENQILYLKEKKPQIIKTASLQNKKETIKTRDVDWEKELALFIQADINKPSSLRNYNVTRQDSSSYEYKLKPGIDLPVLYLKVVTDSTTKAPKLITAELQSSNKIYESKKSVELKCAMVDNLWQISSYSVKGFQKLVFMEPKTFNISSKIGL